MGLKYIICTIMFVQMNLLGPMVYARWLNILTNQITAFGVYSVLNGRLNFNWSFEKINPDMTPYRMLLDVSVLPKKS